MRQDWHEVGSHHRKAIKDLLVEKRRESGQPDINVDRVLIILDRAGVIFHSYAPCIYQLYFILS